MREYLLVALGFYYGAACVNFKSLKDASIVEILKGILVALIFPVVGIFLIHTALTKDDR